MARDLAATIEDAFYDCAYRRCYSCRQGTPETRARKFLDIPVGGNTFEIPVMAFEKLRSISHRDREYRDCVIAAHLNDTGSTSRYSTLDRNMKDVLEESFSSSRLVALTVKQGDDNILYYGTCGAVFNRNMEILMMMSYQIETCDQNTDPVFRIVRPILRIDPNVFLSKADPMERYIINKILTASLSITLYENRLLLPSTISCAEDAMKVKVELDKSPFVIHQASVPSISTTNQSLLQVALDHIDEIIR